MTNTLRFIAGDWGTSNLRLYLCEYNPSGNSKVLDTLSGSGIGQLKSGFEEVFFQLVQPWLDCYGSMPVILSGMIGSNIGWKNAPYLHCPVNAEDIATGRMSFTARGISFSILAGLKTTNPLGLPDILRGEELQMLGWLKQKNQGKGKNLFVLPGTHNKWAVVENGIITNFLTAFTGEMFSLLRDNSVLITEKDTSHFNESTFLNAVHTASNLGSAQLIHALFTTRSKQVLGEMKSQDAASYLSGLIIGADILGANKLFANVNNVIVIGESQLTRYYSIALQHFGIAHRRCDPSEIAISGFETIFKQIQLKTNT